MRNFGLEVRAGAPVALHEPAEEDMPCPEQECPGKRGGERAAKEDRGPPTTAAGRPARGDFATNSCDEMADVNDPGTAGSAGSGAAHRLPSAGEPPPRAGHRSKPCAGSGSQRIGRSSR